MTLDGQDATAGMETRIESFIDILHLRKDGDGMSVSRMVQAPLPSDAKISFPQFASYGIAMEHLVQNGLGLTYVMPPRMTRAHWKSAPGIPPDSGLRPLQLNLGCFLECIEQGADTLIQTGGTCRLGYYGERCMSSCCGIWARTSACQLCRL